jgi:hypothetical protein
MCIFAHIQNIICLRHQLQQAFLQQELCLDYAKDLLKFRQTRYAVHALCVKGDHPTHQLLPANFRLGELYRHEGTTEPPSGTGWVRPDEKHRSSGSRLAQQVVKNVSYDIEYGYNLPCEEAPPEPAPEIWTDGYPRTLEGMLPNHPQQMKLFVRATKDVSFGVGAAWKEGNCCKTKAASLGRHPQRPTPRCLGSAWWSSSPDMAFER